MRLPTFVLSAMERLEQNGYECYLVGGCVRDLLLHKAPNDWDICTIADPETVCRIFDDVTCVKTGIAHGTITVIWEQIPLEITTYRTEGVYSDNRHPDRVDFVRSIEEDLNRRDFTVNAIAYHPKRGLLDFHGGIDDLNQSVLRCVGNAEKRFTEDALRILRGLRFASCYGFAIEEQTAAAMKTCMPLLKCVSAERVKAEWDRLLCGKDVEKVLQTFPEAVFEIIPEMRQMLCFEQHNPHHRFTVWDHTLYAVSHCEPTLVVRLALLLHDIAKPACFTTDDDGIGHFYAHATKGANIAKTVLDRLRYDRKTAERVYLLVKYHDMVIPKEKKVLRRWLFKYGEEFLRQLLAVRDGDSRALALDLVQDRLKDQEDIRRLLDEILEEDSCFSLKQLAINGNDVKALGFTGEAIGETLQWALEQVMNEQLSNEREILLSAIRKNT